MTTLAPFELHRATSVAEAGSLLAGLGEGAVVYSGGTELLLLMKLGFAEYEHLVDIKPIEALARLGVRDGTLVIGGAATHRMIEHAPMVKAGWPDLVEMERWVANVRVRSTGTLGGNLAFADPHSDPATFLLAADATVVLVRGERQRSLSLDAFVHGPYETALAHDELLTGIEVPAMPEGSAIGHLRFAFHERPAATVSAFARVTDGRISGARLAIGSVGVVPVLVPGAADALRDQDPLALEPATLAELGRVGADAAAPVSDSNGSDDYKHALVQALVGRAITDAAAKAHGRAGPRP